MNMVTRLGPAHYHALIIANGNYRHLPKLPTSAGDAQDLKQLLEGRYGFEVTLLLDATQQQIGEALYRYQKTLNDADRLLIYFAGYGGVKHVPPPEHTYWAAVEDQSENILSWLPAQVISDDIGEIDARHILLVVDSSFSSALTHTASTIVARANDEQSIRIQWNRKARMVLTSGQDSPVPDADSSNPPHSLFAETLIAILRQNDILLSGEMLAHEVSARMADSAAKLGLKQLPAYADLQDPNHGCGDFFFVPVTANTQVASLNP